MKSLKSASAALTFLHARTDQPDAFLQILRIDSDGRPHGSWVKISELDQAFDDEILDHAEQWNQFVTVNRFSRNDAGRKSENVSAVDTLFLDIDVASDKKPNLPRDTEEALAFLEELPFKPTLVTSSGHGLHAFYSLENAITIASDEDRKQTSRLLKAFQEATNKLAAKHGWKFDSVFDLARGHRIPFSLNLKNGEHAECLPIQVGERVSLDQIKRFCETPKTTPPQKGAYLRSSLLEMLQSEEEWSKAKKKGDAVLPNAAGIHTGCSFLRHAEENAATLSEPDWHAAINLISRCTNGESLAQEISSSYPGYTRSETNRKIREQKDRPAIGCGHIEEALQFAGCQTCRFRGQIKTPAELGSRHSALVKLLTTTAYVTSINAFVDLDDLEAKPLSAEQFRRHHAGQGLSGQADDLFLNDKLASKVTDRIWDPQNDQRLVKRGSKLSLNTYIAPRHIQDSDVDARLFFEHLDFLIHDEKEREVVIDYLAHLVQKPGEKITYCVTLVSPQGAGKSYIAEAMSLVLGQSNTYVANGHSIGERFNRHLAGRVLLIMEEVSMDDRSKVYESLKALISNERDEFEGKNLPKEEMPTPRGTFALTNHTHALYLAKDDRRFFVVNCNGPHPDGHAYYDKLFAALKSPAFIAAVYMALKTRNISQFQSKRVPFETAAKRVMIENSIPEAEVLVRQLIEDKQSPFDRNLATIEELEEAVRNASPSDAKFGRKQITRALMANGWKSDPEGRQVLLPNGTKRRFWMQNSSQYAGLTAAQLGKAYIEMLKAENPALSFMQKKQVGLSSQR